MIRAVIIGSGNVAEAFARALPGCGVEVVQVYARNRERGVMVAAIAGCGYADEPQRLASAEVYIAAVSDRAIGEVYEPLAIPDTAVALHVSGGQPMEAIPAKAAHRGVLYPLQTFTSGREVDFREIPLFVEASDPFAAGLIDDLAHRLSRDVRRADTAQRVRIHAAGVFACNFVNAMYGAGCEVARLADMPFEILKPLIMETARKACGCDDPRSVQTGPAVRGDRTTMERHLAMLDECGKEELTEIYNIASKYIANIAN